MSPLYASDATSTNITSVWMVQEDPEPTKAKLEKFLESKGIPYKYGTKTKFANFRQKTLE